MLSVKVGDLVRYSSRPNNEIGIIVKSDSRCSGTFAIPDPKVSGNPQFNTGDLLFKLTASSTDASNPASFAQTTYSAQGILETQQETIIATRNGEIVKRTVNDKTSRTGQTTFDRVVGTVITRPEEIVQFIPPPQQEQNDNEPVSEEPDRDPTVAKTPIISSGVLNEKGDLNKDKYDNNVGGSSIAGIGVFKVM